METSLAAIASGLVHPCFRVTLHVAFFLPIIETSLAAGYPELIAFDNEEHIV